MSRFSHSTFPYSHAHYHYNEEGLLVHKDDYRASEHKKKQNSHLTNDALHKGLDSTARVSETTTY